MADDATMVDAAVLKQAKGRSSLPPAHHEDWDRLFLAFEHHESGNDVAMLEALRGIGVRSPFAEWKLMLRGQLAYAQRQDARAIENWSRLQPTRVPYSLIAPLWQHIDPAFAAQQSPDALTRLKRLHATMDLAPAGEKEHGLVRKLGEPPRGVRGMERAIKDVRHVVKDWMKRHPPYAARLSNIVYWSICDQGAPKDLDAHRAIFGAPEQDPKYDRLQAIVMEKIDQPIEMVKYWNDYVNRLQLGLPNWTATDVRIAQGLICYRIVEYLDEIVDVQYTVPRRGSASEILKKLLRDNLLKSYQYAPELPESTTRLILLLTEEKQYDQALEIGNAHLVRYPHNPQLLDTMATLHDKRGEFESAFAYVRRLREAAPLSAGSAARLTTIGLSCIRHWMQNKADAPKMLEAIECLEAEGLAPVTLWATRLVMAQKAKDAATVERLTAAPPSTNRCVVAYVHLVEAIRVKLTPAVKKLIADRFKQVFGAECDPFELFEAIKAQHGYQLVTPKYTGLATHLKVMLDRLEIDAKRLDADGLAMLCKRWKNELPSFEEHWSKRKFQAILDQHPRDPRIIYFAALGGRISKPDYRLKAQLRTAVERLATPQYAPYAVEYLGLIEEYLDKLEMANPFFGYF